MKKGRRKKIGKAGNEMTRGYLVKEKEGIVSLRGLGAWGLGLGGGSFRKCGEGEGGAIGSADLMCLLMCLLGT